jgi:hypothetical protein
VGQRVAVRIGLDGLLRIFHAEQLVASHTLKNPQAGWSTLREHQSEMWKNTLPQVEQRSLSVYEEVL